MFKLATWAAGKAVLFLFRRCEGPVCLGEKFPVKKHLLTIRIISLEMMNAFMDGCLTFPSNFIDINGLLAHFSIPNGGLFLIC
ncbi:hypothetical protein [Chromobacterium sphagni]|uniref:hypothetical protein n=1 Tax=Chromobacterium sphagni TaxID=1903179 RepID=UPI0019D3982A|nr:hypothetical protein [Chromobacterium sphagni]